MITEKIRVWGIVQGVGFRPFVAKLAHSLNMRGEVLNIGGLVDITVTDTKERIEEFLKALKENKPLPAEIVHIKRSPLEYREFNKFTILDSSSGGDEAAMIPADLAICKHCLEELRDNSNPRYEHPFISCMICGPRYTIMDKIPYDRENTAMIEFPMCDFCYGEYTNLEDLRYHAQTISCFDCGPQLEIGTIDGGELNFSSDQIIQKSAELIKAGKVIAFKSVGGYNLICSPFSKEAVDNLRELKGREEKPFAIMFKELEDINKYCYTNETEKDLLESSARPIILLEKKEDIQCREFENSRFIGAFLPSMGAQYMLLEKCDIPLIVTSANKSGMPIIKDEAEIFGFIKMHSDKLDAVIYNNRRINVRVDDSVVRVIDGQPQMIRRSKGYAPVPLYMLAGAQTLALGGQLKNSFCLTKGSFAYMSQYFGDLDSLENYNIYKESIESMKELFHIEPEKVACDMHPLYESTKFAEEYAKKKGLPLIKVQHHHAHIASVMAEHNLKDAVIGVSFDGTGYGTDGAVWGGEVLICEGGSFERFSHLKYVTMLGGDSSMKSGIKSAMSYLIQEEIDGDKAKGKIEKQDIEKKPLGMQTPHEFQIVITDILDFHKEENENNEAHKAKNLLKHKDWKLVKGAIENKINTIQSSSMGRLFDGVSALLGIKEENDYEGQCAIMLEEAADRAIKGSQKKKDTLALAFHQRVAEKILEQCTMARAEKGINKVVLTGGTFQNRILTEKALELLRKEEFNVYYNISVSPNDGGIALGQAYVARYS